MTKFDNSIATCKREGGKTIQTEKWWKQHDLFSDIQDTVIPQEPNVTIVSQKYERRKRIATVNDDEGERKGSYEGHVCHQSVSPFSCFCLPWVWLDGSAMVPASRILHELWPYFAQKKGLCRLLRFGLLGMVGMRLKYILIRYQAFHSIYSVKCFIFPHALMVTEIQENFATENKSFPAGKRFSRYTFQFARTSIHKSD